MSEGIAEPVRRAQTPQEGHSPHATLDIVRNHFYRCQFQAVIGLVDDVLLSIRDHRKMIDLQLFKINALYETHQATRAKTLLEELVRTPLNNAPAALNYARGRLAYFDEDFGRALDMFHSIEQFTDDPVMRFRGLLGVANVYYSTSQFDLIPQVLADLNTSLLSVNAEEQISFEILMGNFYRSAGIDRCLARKYFERGLSQASAQSWNYFTYRCLYGLATIEQEQENQAALFCILNLLKHMLKGTEAGYFRFLVNEKFKNSDFSLPTPIEFDHHRMRVRIDEQWHHFHSKPLLYKFLVVLHRGQKFVPKSELAAELWPDQRYLPRTHDPRIFDIAKRVRSVIEAYEHNPVVLLSGRQGYKLATANASPRALQSIPGGK